jgi:phosphotransacetylase
MVRGKGIRVVYPEGRKERAIRAAALLRDEDLAKPILLGDADIIDVEATSFGVDLRNIELRNPLDHFDLEKYSQTYFELRKHIRNHARVRRRASAIAALLLCADGETGGADGIVSGLNSETKPFVPAVESCGKASNVLPHCSCWSGRSGFSFSLIVPSI